MFTENQHLVEFSPIMKVSFQRTKRGEFYTHYFIEVLTYVAVSRNFIRKWITWRLSSQNIIILRISLIRVSNHFLINCIHVKFLFRMYLKEIFSLSCRSWEVLRFKFERSFKNHGLINSGLVVQKSLITSPVRVKSFFTLKNSLPKMLLSGLVCK